MCVVGSGGREHALGEALARTADVVVCPGNAGMAALGVTCVTGPPDRLDADLFVIGPEQPLVDGLADRLRAAGKLVFGPGADGARLEGSKAWMKHVLAEAGVPTAAHGVFDEAGAAIEFLKSLPPPWVVKTDGLAAGKGVLVTDDLEAACADVESKIAGASFGEAGRRVVVEEGLCGTELSLMAVCDGTRAVALEPAQDFKRALDDDRGPNTGGMGAYSPVPVANHEVVKAVMAEAVKPTLSWLGDHGIDFRGVLYAGLMLTAEGPKVLEFNVRFGDPETQVLMPRWQGDIAGILAGAARGRLDEMDAPDFTEDAAVCVVAAAPGYPESVQTGASIEGLETPLTIRGVHVFAAGVGENLTTSGGRVLGLTGTAVSLREARNKAYEAVGKVSFPGMQFRTDIAALAADQQEGKR